MADEQVIVLSDKQQARTRINVWHGSANNYINVIKELIGNALDVFPKNELNTIKIILHDSNKIEYEDTGKGIPVEGVASNGMNNYEAIFEKPFAGTKYNNVQDTVGQNGIFLWTLSMTCENIQYEIARPNKNIYKVAYHKGDRVDNLKIDGKSDTTYTKMLFELDKSVWEKPTFTFEQICEIAKGQASLANAKIIIEDKVYNKKEVFYYENGIIDYFGTIAKDKTFVCTPVVLQTAKVFDIIYKEQEVKDPISVNMIFSYSNDNNQDIRKEFLNTADLILYGTIQEGIISGLRNIIHSWLLSNNKYKKEKNKTESYIKLEDVLQGLNYVCDVRSLYVEYENQTKQRTLAGNYKIALNTIIKDFIEIYFIENKEQAEKICTQVLINKRVRENSDASRQNLKKKLTSENVITNKIEGLIECKSKNREETILCICEGKSALSAMISGRQDIHALFPLRGKILNCLKAPLAKILNNEVIRSLIIALGCGIEVKSSKNDMFDIKKLRYSKIYIYVDSDFDGIGSILPLLLTAFWKLTPTLVKEGRIYICETPKYEIAVGDDYLYAVDDYELENIEKQLNGKKYTLHYIKGLSELSPEAMAMCLKPDYKNIVQIGLDDIEQSIKMLELFMGEKIEPRREYILENF